MQTVFTLLEKGEQGLVKNDELVKTAFEIISRLIHKKGEFFIFLKILIISSDKYLISK
jgi:hypothetical protein